MPESSARRAVERAQAHALELSDVVDAELVELDEEPPRDGSLILLGRAALVRADHDPDLAGEDELDEDLREARPKKTVAAEHYQWGRWIWWNGKTARDHLPPPGDPRSMHVLELGLRHYIKAHLTLRRDPADAKLWKPYAYNTVAQAVSLVCSIYERIGYPGLLTKKVSAQLEWYEYALRKQRIPKVPNRSVAITPAESVRIARQCNQAIISGLRAATAFRILADTGMRVSELLALRFGNVRWVSETQVVLHIEWSKTKEPRDVPLQAPPPTAKNADVDPFLLFRTWYQLAMDRGHAEPTMFVFPEVHPARARRDGTVAGSFDEEPWDYEDLRREWAKYVAAAGVDVEPVTGRRRKATTHGNRSGFITAAGLAGIRQELVAAVTGHSLTSESFWRYFRVDTQWGDTNPGYVLRSQQEDVE